MISGAVAAGGTAVSALAAEAEVAASVGPVESPIGAAFAAWAASPDAAEETAAGALVRPIFDAGDALIFDHLNLHRTAIDPGMARDRHAIETWLFSPSTYDAMTTSVDDGYSPRDQIPLLI